MDIANEIALMVCRSCKKLESESDVDFSTRLYKTFCDCHDIVQALVDDEQEQMTKANFDAIANLPF